MRRLRYTGIGVFACVCLAGCIPLFDEEPIAFEEQGTYPRISINGIEVQAPPPKVRVPPPPPPPPPPIVVIKPPAPKPKPEAATITARVSAYCPCRRCCERMTGITATQTNAWKPGVAADLSWLSPGTKVEVPGYGQSVIDDTGGKLKRRWWSDGTPRLDVRFDYHWQAREWGIQYLPVKVYR